MILYDFETTPAPQSQPNKFYSGAPRLVPAGTGAGNFNNITGGLFSGSNNFIAQQTGTGSTIDVVYDFQWTTTPKSGRYEVPEIQLREKRLKTNALIAQALYYSGTVAGALQSGITAFSNLTQSQAQAFGFATGAAAGAGFGGNLGALGKLLGGAVGGFTGGGVFSSLFGNNSLTQQTAVGTFQGALGGFSDLAGGLLSQLPANLNIEGLGSDVLQAYEGLYITEDTRFLYRMPFFSKNQNSVGNSFGENDQILNSRSFEYEYGPFGFFSQLRDVSYNVAKSVSRNVNIFEPGIYIEKPKFYEFSSGGAPFSFTFPLINTGHSTFEDVLNNWQLLFMLTYQNRPNRKTRDLIDPPCIYEVTIPGVKYFPFAYISKMSIDYIGNRRKMYLTVPVQGGGVPIDTIVPDAYEVSITLTPLVAESQNFLYAMLTDKQQLINVYSTRRPADDIRNFVGNPTI